jgi:hypothetical protein
MKPNLVFGIWHWSMWVHMFLGFTIVVISLMMFIMLSSNMMETAEHMFGSNEMNHYNWKHFSYH